MPCMQVWHQHQPCTWLLCHAGSHPGQRSACERTFALRGCNRYDDVPNCPCAGLRTIGTNISPAFGYYDTPALNLNSAQPVNSSSPLPVPAGVYDLMLNYTSNGNAQCGSASNTLPAAFIIQVFPLKAPFQKNAWACRGEV